MPASLPNDVAWTIFERMLLIRRFEEAVLRLSYEKKFTALGFDPIVASQADADKMFSDEVEKWGTMVKALNLSIN